MPHTTGRASPLTFDARRYKAKPSQPQDEANSVDLKFLIESDDDMFVSYPLQRAATWHEFHYVHPRYAANHVCTL